MFKIREWRCMYTSSNWTQFVHSINCYLVLVVLYVFFSNIRTCMYYDCRYISPPNWFSWKTVHFNRELWSVCMRVVYYKVKVWMKTCYVQKTCTWKDFFFDVFVCVYLSYHWKSNKIWLLQFSQISTIASQGAVKQFT